MDTETDQMEEQLSNFVGKKYHTYYRKAWNNKPADRLFISWNISAFLFGAFWWVYRKIYRAGIFYIIFLTVLDILAHFTAETEEQYYMMIFIPCFIVWVLNGLFGNCIYYRKTMKTLQSMESSGEMTEKSLKRKGGTSIASIILFLIFPIAEGLLMYYIF